MTTPHPYRLAGITLLVGVVSFTLPAYAQTHKHSPAHDHATHAHTDICAGFVVLPNGYAVLSAMDPAPHAGTQHDMRHGADHGKAGAHPMAESKATNHQAHMPQGAKTEDADPLLGHTHGDDIPTGTDMTCVPIGDLTSTSWTAVSPSPDLHVTATSVKSVLAHNSRANESLSLHVMQDGKPVEQGKVRLIARMPHHDHRMPGGHGPANDPDVQGFEAIPQGNGNYTVPTVDFNMGGPWFFEIQVQEGETMHKAYFATEVGEE
jgi:YtkA-like